MATEYTVKKITELDEKTTAEDTDLLAVGGGGAATLKKMTLAKLAEWIKTKVSGFTYALNTGTQTLIAGLNALSVATGSQQYAFNGAGYITSSSTSVVFTVPTNKVRVGRTVQSVTVGALQLRQNNTTVYNQTDPTDVSVDINLSGACGLNLTLQRTSGGSTVAWNADNNSVIAVYIRFTVVWG